MHRGHCFFAIRLCSAKGGHGRPGRVETGLLFSHHAHWNQAADRSTQAVPPDQRDALCPSPKIQKQAALLVLVGIWDDFRRPPFVVGGAHFFIRFWFKNSGTSRSHATQAARDDARATAEGSPKPEAWRNQPGASESTCGGGVTGSWSVPRISLFEKRKKGLTYRHILNSERFLRWQGSCGWNTRGRFIM